jgi:pyruvate formate lyase activating enzyme
MRIGSLFENSLIDWEGKLTAVIFTKGCNFRCGYCHNPSLVIPELINLTEDIPEDKVLTFLRKRKIWLDGVVVTGGEPTIHKDLPEFIHKIKEIGLMIKLDTNGTNPSMVKNLLMENLIDYIALDIKTILNPADYSIITNRPCEYEVSSIKETIGCIRSSGKKYELRTTILPGLQSSGIIEKLEHEFMSEKFNKNILRIGDCVEDWNSQKYRSQNI